MTIGVEIDLVFLGLAGFAAEPSFIVAQVMKPWALKYFPNGGVLSEQELLRFHAHESTNLKMLFDSSFQVKPNSAVRSQVQVEGRTETGAPLKISTPILRNGTFEIIVPELLAFLRKRFVVHTNKSASIHVHVGIGRPYSWYFFRRLAQAVMMWEVTMDKHHPDKFGPHNPFLSSNRRTTSEAVGEVIARINHQQDAPSVLRLVQSSYSTNYLPSKCFKYNLLPTLDENYNTMEFRQARSTLDVEWILDWIRRVTCFVLTAIVTSSAQYMIWAEEGTVYGQEVPVKFGCPVDDPESWCLGPNDEIELQSAVNLETGVTTFIPIESDSSEGLTESTLDDEIMT